MGDADVSRPAEWSMGNFHLFGLMAPIGAANTNPRQRHRTPQMPNRPGLRDGRNGEGAGCVANLVSPTPLG